MQVMESVRLTELRAGRRTEEHTIIMFRPGRDILQLSDSRQTQNYKYSGAEICVRSRVCQRLAARSVKWTQ